MTKKSDGQARPIRVLQLLADPQRHGDRPIDNPYSSLLVLSLPHDRVRTSYFRWARIFTERFDVLHVHWPENSLRHARVFERIVKNALFALFLVRIRLQRKPVVRTVHNVQPHEDGSWVERLLLERLERLTTLWIILNEKTPTPDPSRTVLVPHGHYRDWYTPVASAVPVAGRLLNFGRIRGYKGTPELLHAFIEADDAELSLHILGRPDDDATGARVGELAAFDSRIHVDLRFVSDQELADAIASAEVVVLPYLAMHNSGAALLALSLGRPVVVPSSPTTELLVDEFGPGWVHTYAGPLDAPTLLELVRLSRSADRDPDGPDLSRREWTAIGDLLVDAYERAVSQPRRVRREPAGR
ncbi:glycosyltransferase [Microbacterium sp. B2969]|uniref:Glycosyltransferase n=1 Tax=Microbacterium alkaliflavum TaxID=3248839 RepID=A0ABW7QBA1_9MICO